MTHDLIHPDVRPLTPVPPRWVDELLGPGPATYGQRDGGLGIQTAGAYAYATACIPDAVQMDAQALRGRVASAYLGLIRALAELNRYPVRFWNFVPGIGDPIAPDLDRYMVFNAGRYDAYMEWYGPQRISTDASVPIGTASAVGITGSDLSIHCLAMERPGEAVENPRQTSAWQYSARYGPLPPWFSRATIVQLQGRPQLLIGGTASVVGEDSRHADSLAAQMDETLLNLEALISAAGNRSARYAAPLQRLVDLRVHTTTAAHADIAARILSQRCPHVRAIELVVAQICRRELLIEIEGVAEL